MENKIMIRESKLSSDYLEKVRKSVVKKGFNIDTRDIHSYVSSMQSKPITRDIFNVLIADILNAYFGVKYENMSEAISVAAYDYLTNTYPDIRVDDMTIPFRRNPPKKISGVGITVQELVAPVEKWMEVRKKIKASETEESERLKRELKESDRLKQEYEDEKNRIMEHFNLLLSDGVETWDLSDEKALYISKEVSKGIVSPEEKRIIYNETIEEKKAEKLKEKRGNTICINNMFSEMVRGYEYSTFEIRCICARKTINLTLIRKKNGI